MEFLKNPTKRENNNPDLGLFINKKLIFIQGRSLGGAVACYMAQK